MLFNKLALILLGTATVVATLPMEKRDAAELVRRLDPDAEVSRRAHVLSERQNGNNSGGGCAPE